MLESMLRRYDLENINDFHNALREILQEIALAGLYRGGFFEKTAFYGGTCLRIFYGLDRFSEDLDFSLLVPNEGFFLDPYFQAIEALVREHFGTVMRRFVEALQSALPGLRKEVVDDRFRFVIGTLSHVFSGTFDLDVIPGHIACEASDEERIQHLIIFLAAGLRAPNPPLGSLSASPAALPRSGGVRDQAGRPGDEGMKIRKEARR